jgi:hypothetical protein
VKLNIEKVFLPCYTPRYAVRFILASSKLQQLYTDRMGATRYPPEVVDAFIEEGLHEH